MYEILFQEAEDHGLGVSQSGIVFASIFILQVRSWNITYRTYYQYLLLTSQIIFVPVFGKLTSKIGSTRLFIAGVFLAGNSQAQPLADWIKLN